MLKKIGHFQIRDLFHVLQEKIIVCFAYIYTPFTF